MYEERISGGLKFIPEDPSSPIPVVIAPGIGVSFRACSLLVNTLCTQGRTVICPDYPPPTAERPGKWFIFTDADYIKQERLRNIIESQEAPFDGIAISKGLYDILPAAKSHSDKLRALVLLAPAILPEGNLFANLWKLFMRDRKNQQDKTQFKGAGGNMTEMFRMIEEESRNYKRDWRSYYPEIITLATKAVHKQLQELKDAGIRIVVVAPNQDPLFPWKSYQNLIQDSVDAIIPVYGPHGAFKFDSKVSEIIAGQLK